MITTQSPEPNAQSAFGRDDAARMLNLLAAPGERIALRSLWKPEQAEEKHFTDHAAALDYLNRYDGQRALYVVLNPLRADATPSVKDSGIACLRWFPLDADPKRPADTASTDAELALAKTRMRDVLAFLSEHIPDLSGSVLRALSGNGAHAVIRLPDYPPSEAVRLKRLGDALNRRFSDEAVELDRAIYNPARIWRVYGTKNVKGNDSAERPHRRASLPISPGFVPVPLDLLAYETALLNALGIDPAASERKAHQKGTRQSRSYNNSYNNSESNTHDDNFAPPEGSEEAPSLPPWWGEAVPAGGRNHAAFRRARWLVNKTEGNRTDAEAWTLLKAWNLTCCRPGLDAGELRKAFESAFRGGDDPDYAAPASEAKPFPAAPVPKCPDFPADALYGLAGAVVRAIEPHTEGDPVGLLIQFLAAFGNAIGRGAYFQAEADRHGGNLFAVLVGISSKGRKGSSWGHIRSLFETAEPLWAGSRVLSGLSSGEGLLHQVRDPLEKEETDKKTGERQTVTVDAGVTDKRLFVLESELASVLRQTQRDGNTLSATLRNAWDTGTLHSLTKNSPSRATGSHVSIVGHITRDELRKDLAETETANGFGNRFLWLCVRRSKELPDGGQIETVDLDPLIFRLQAAIHHARQITRLQRDSAAREIWHAVYHDLSTGKPGLLGSMTGRSEAQVMRLALLYALLDGDSAIRAEHLTAALSLWEYCEASARYIFGDSLGDRVADDILRALRGAKDGLSRTELRDLFQKNQSGERIEQALGVLAEHGLAHSERRETDGKGRPVEIWKATTLTT